MNLESINNSSLYIGEVVSLDKETWVITFICRALSTEAELKAAPLFNHTYEIVPGEQILVIKPNDNFSDNLFYHPITLRKFIGLKHADSYIDMTDPDRIYITTPITLELKAGDGHITVSNNSIIIQGNTEVLGTLGVKNAYSGTIMELNGAIHTVRKGIIID